jgi:hypothetical protein
MRGILVAFVAGIIISIHSKTICTHCCQKEKSAEMGKRAGSYFCPCWLGSGLLGLSRAGRSYPHERPSVYLSILKTLYIQHEGNTEDKANGNVVFW